MLRETSKTLRPVGKIHVALFDIDQMGDELRAGARRTARSIQNAFSSIIQSLKMRIKGHSLQRLQIAFVCKNVRRLHCNELCGLIVVVAVVVVVVVVAD